MRGKNSVKKIGINMNKPDINFIAEMARKLRLDVITMLHAAKSGHPGGALSSADIISTLYFGDMLKVDPENP